MYVKQWYIVVNADCEISTLWKSRGSFLHHFLCIGLLLCWSANCPGFARTVPESAWYCLTNH